MNARLRETSKGASSLDTVVVALLEDARRSHDALPLSAWTAALARALGPAEAVAFEHAIVRGEDAPLPKGVLGHCYRAGSGDYVTFDLGFDAFATERTATGEVVGLEADGPAARAGLKAGDRVEAEYREGHAEVPVTLTVTRGGDTMKLKYLPKGVTYRGPTWTRLPGTTDEQCGDSW